MKRVLFLLFVSSVLIGCNENGANNNESETYMDTHYLQKNFHKWIKNTISYITIDETDFANQLKTATYNVSDDKLLTAFLQTVESGASCDSRNRSIIYLYAIGFVAYVSQLDSDIQESVDTTLSRLLARDEISLLVLSDPLGFDALRIYSEGTDETIDPPDDTPCRSLYYDINKYRQLSKQYMQHLRDR